MQYPDDADGRVLADLASQGVDLSRPRLMEFAVDVPNEDVANRVASAIRAIGYDVQVFFDEGEPDTDGTGEDGFGPSWTVYATVQMRPEYDRIVAIQAELDALAQPLGGRADGWGTLINVDERSR